MSAATGGIDPNDLPDPETDFRYVFTDVEPAGLDAPVDDVRMAADVIREQIEKFKGAAR